MNGKEVELISLTFPEVWTKYISPPLVWNFVKYFPYFELKGRWVELIMRRVGREGGFLLAAFFFSWQKWVMIEYVFLISMRWACEINNEKGMRDIWRNFKLIIAKYI